MKHIFDLKGKFIDALDKMLNDWKYEDLNGLRQELREDSHRGLLSDSELVNIHQRIDDLNEKDMYENYKVWDIAENIKASKTIIFKREQALVFWDFAVKKKVSIDFPYKLPYPSILIQFDNLIELRLKTETGDDIVQRLGGILLTEDEFQDCKAVMIFSDFTWFRASWEIDEKTCGFRYDVSDISDPKVDCLVRFAWALVLFITSENVILEAQSSVAPHSDKAKAKGKSKFEPYYVCRIRGVQYDSEGYEKGAGVKHGIRYDVRGHFRRLETGKTIWVRPHQRGLQNELYVPKTYVVAKEPHQ